MPQYPKVMMRYHGKSIIPFTFQRVGSKYFTGVKWQGKVWNQSERVDKFADVRIFDQDVADEWNALHAEYEQVQEQYLDRLEKIWDKAKKLELNREGGVVDDAKS